MAVVVGDAAVGHLERVAQLGRHPVDGTRHHVGRDGQGVEAHPVEALGQLDQGGVAPGPHRGQDLGHGR